MHLAHEALRVRSSSMIAPTMTPTIHIASTLGTMREIYGLSRDGGPRSERFAAYVARVEHAYGLSAFNPMAGAAALECVEALIALDAERLAHDAARDVATACAYDAPITLAVVVGSPGLWTDRLATEVEHRTTQARADGRGLAYLWTKEPVSADDVRREATAEAVRVMWTALHPAPPTLHAVLAREGLASALAGETGHDEPAVRDALDVLGDSAVMGEIGGVLYGDAAAEALGWQPLGIPDRGGLRWAVARATAIIADRGAPNALRSSPTDVAGL